MKHLSHPTTLHFLTHTLDPLLLDWFRLAIPAGNFHPLWWINPRPSFRASLRPYHEFLTNLCLLGHHPPLVSLQHPPCQVVAEQGHQETRVAPGTISRNPCVNISRPTRDPGYLRYEQQRLSSVSDFSKLL